MTERERYTAMEKWKELIIYHLTLTNALTVYQKASVCIEVQESQ